METLEIILTEDPPWLETESEAGVRKQDHQEASDTRRMEDYRQDQRVDHRNRKFNRWLESMEGRSTPTEYPPWKED